uniref:NADH dehydrogenase subunit 6 n=1 Tax=Atta opaciceps TaxID=592322 RepID=A0A249RWG0_9HYME|nr:NADH dehydrogenase subunit 6 [Atta opaciceps]
MTKFSNIFLLSMFSLLFLITFMMLINMFNISSMIILLMIYSLVIFTILSFWSENYIYSIILFLTLISGLLVIFLYFTSLISNMKNNFYIKPILIITLLINMLFMFFSHMSNFTFLMKKFNLIFINSHIFHSNFIINTNKKMFENIFNLYFYPYNNFTFICMLFLLLTMFMIIKICSTKSSSLRKIN